MNAAVLPMMPIKPPSNPRWPTYTPHCRDCRYHFKGTDDEGRPVTMCSISMARVWSICERFDTGRDRA